MRVLLFSATGWPDDETTVTSATHLPRVLCHDKDLYVPVRTRSERGVIVGEMRALAPSERVLNLQPPKEANA